MVDYIILYGYTRNAMLAQDLILGRLYYVSIRAVVAEAKIA
jgi:hypothetical protein